MKFIKLKNTVMVTTDGKTYTVSNGHPLFEQIVEAIDRGELEGLQGIVEHNDREDFLDSLTLKPKKMGE